MLLFGRLYKGSKLSVCALRTGFSQATQNRETSHQSKGGGRSALKPQKQKRIKRGGRRQKHKSENLTIFSTNAAGLKNKSPSLRNEINSLNAAVFTIQETHFNKKGKFVMKNYEIFEAIRNKEKGGTLIGVHASLNPILITEYSEQFELLVVEMKIRNQEIWIMSGYGPQESWKEDERLPFFIALESEIAKAELSGKSVIIELDSNSKLGPDYVPNDPHDQSPNGLLLAGVIDRHGLCVANGLRDKCRGTITRKRVTKESTEESVIDHVLISKDLEEDFKELIIDEE